jgi:hypothetical protein
LTADLADRDGRRRLKTVDFIHTHINPAEGPCRS